MTTAVVKQAPIEGPLAPAARGKFLEAFAGRLGRLTPEQQTAFLMALGEHIGVRAELGEVIIYMDKPYVTYDGRVRQAHATGLLTGLDARPATTQERRDYQVGDGVHLWRAAAFRRGTERRFEGWGEAGQPGDKNPISKDKPAQMAKKRARYDALRAAFPVGEDITPMHREYIEDAERVAQAQRGKTQPLVAASYEEIPEGAETEAGHEVAAIAPTGADPYALDHEATAEQLTSIAKLLVDPKIRDMRPRLEKRLDKGLTQHEAKTMIAFMEALIHPQSAEPRTGDSSTASDELGLGDQRATRDAVRAGL